MIQLTFQFDTVEAAAEFLAAQGARAPQVNINIERQEPSVREIVEDLIATKKPRQPRSDAGKSRGPYKKSTESAAPQAGDGASSVSATAVTDGAEGGKNSPAPAADLPAPVVVPGVQLTIDAIKAEMSVLSKKKGIDANIQLLAKFGVQKVSSLPEARYAEFVDAVRAAVAA